MQRGPLTFSIHWTGTACPAQVLPCRLTPLSPPSNVTYTPDTQQTASIGSPPLQSNSCLKKGRRWQSSIAHKQWAHLGLSGICTRNKPFQCTHSHSNSNCWLSGWGLTWPSGIHRGCSQVFHIHTGSTNHYWRPGRGLASSTSPLVAVTAQPQ